MRNLAVILLAIWLIASGLLPLFNVSIPSSDVILAVLAVAAGVLLLLNRGEFRLPRNLGVLLLGVWLILAGALPLLSISFPSSEIVLGLLAAAAGVLILLKR